MWRIEGRQSTECDGDGSNTSTETLADRFIARVDTLSEAVGIPVNLTEVQLNDFQANANDALAEARSSYAVPRVMRKAHVTKILESVSSGSRNVSFV